MLSELIEGDNTFLVAIYLRTVYESRHAAIP
jgi:hypothetical protein